MLQPFFSFLRKDAILSLAPAILGNMIGIIIMVRQQKKKYRIKYDCRDRNILLTIAVVSTILCIGLISVLSVMDDLSAEVGAFLMIGGYIFFPLLAATTWMEFIRSILYIRRLKKYGYEIPVYKKSYSSDLCQLNRVQKCDMQSECCNIGSLVLSLVADGILACVVIGAIMFYCQYSGMGDLKYFGMKASVPLYLLWFFLAWKYWRQRSNDKYRDDVEIDNDRKVRKSVEDGILEIVVFLYITIFWMRMICWYAEYICAV